MVVLTATPTVRHTCLDCGLLGFFFSRRIIALEPLFSGVEAVNVVISPSGGIDRPDWDLKSTLGEKSFQTLLVD